MNHSTPSHGNIECRDRGSGLPLVFLHGIQGTQRAWDSVAEGLLPGYRVITPNLRGRGASFTPADPACYRLEAFASDLESVAGAVGEPFVLIGYSMGVLVALEYIARRGCDGLRGLVLVSGSACLGNEGRWFHGRDLAEISREAAQRAASLGLKEAASPLAVAASWQHVQRADHRGVLGKVSVPTLVIHGTHDDQCPPAHGRLLAEGVPGAEWRAWPGCGHNPMAFDSPRLADAIASFAAAVAPRNPTAVDT